MAKTLKPDGAPVRAHPGINTLLAHAGLDPQAFHGFVNPPLVRASTVLFDSVEAMRGRREARYSYGLDSTPTIEALATALNALEGAAGTVLVPSGLAAVTIAILSAVRAGGRILVPDNVYGPTRHFCDESLPVFGVETTYYDPLAGADIAPQIAGASALLLEAPGSHTFEMPDLLALVGAAQAAGAVTMMDNTWATPLIYRPLDHGIAMSIAAGTKYQAGHSDLLIGSVCANAKAWPSLKRLHGNLGLQAGVEEIWLTLRGLRTMGVRLQRHEASALAVARWLQDRSEVARVLHPALPEDPGHSVWRRDFGRSTGLFAFVLAGEERQAEAFLDALRLFGLGYSWGGFESLAVLSELDRSRTVRPWTEGPVIRLHIGLEDVEDLIADLEAGFAAMAAAMRSPAPLSWLESRGGTLALRGYAFAKAEFAMLLTILVLAGGLWAFIGIAEEVGEGETLPFDRAILLSLRNPSDLSDPIGPLWLEGMMRDVTALGSHFAVVFITVAVLGYLLLAGKRGAALFVLVSVGGGMLLSSVLKIGFERTRPDLVPHGVRVFTASFPSGHATLAAVTYLTLGALLARFEARRRLRIYYLAVAALLTAAVGVSRVYLGVHWPTDVLAGWSVGAAWAMAVWLAALLLQRRGKVEQPGEAKPPGPIGLTRLPWRCTPESKYSDALAAFFALPRRADAGIRTADHRTGHSAVW